MADESSNLASRLWAELSPFFGWLGAAILAIGSGIAGSILSKRREDRRSDAESKLDEAAAAKVDAERDITVGGAWKQYALDQVEILQGRVEAQSSDIAEQQRQLSAAQILTADLGSKLTEALTQLQSALAANLALTQRNHRLEQEVANLRKALGDVPAAT